MTKRTMTAALVLTLAVAACSSGSTPAPTSMGSEMPMGSDHMDEPTGALGEAGDPAAADRTIHMTADDQLKFDPASIEVKVGETIAFEIENVGIVDHEFVLGSAEYQAHHEEEMQAGGMEMGMEPNEVEVAEGETASLTWHFTEAGTTQFGCHEPGHFPAGMYGTITVSP
ncbi:MAG TPA: plastocyanin/azurin family copper-binding protein [Candidatus Deferrimicrobiaceae bacterium]|nr:plastocyanin/azurin family copper-binding protein [Candidatus Deferrimicrobiaceae bacterium]